MALSDLSFKLYNDSALTIPFGGVLSVTHQTDLSDNPADFILYFGSVTSGRQLQSNVDPGVASITLTPTDILPSWLASADYAVDEAAEPIIENGYRYVVTVAGTSGSTEPVWPTTIGQTVTDGGVEWRTASATHEPTEVKLALSVGGLDSALPGAAMEIGQTITTGSTNAVPIHIRITNSVNTVSDNSNQPEIGLFISEVIETAV